MSTIDSNSLLNSIYSTNSAAQVMSFTSADTEEEEVSFNSLLEDALNAVTEEAEIDGTEGVDTTTTDTDDTDDSDTDDADADTDDTDTSTSTTTSTGSSSIFADYRFEGYDPLDVDDMPSDTLSFYDMLNLMMVQFQSQSIDNTADTTEMMNQLNMMTMTQAVTEMSANMEQTYQMNVQMYNASLVGQEVTVGYYDDSYVLHEICGTVVASGFYDGQPVIFLDGVDDPFYTSDILAVGRLPASTTDDDTTEDDTTVDTDDTTVDTDVDTDTDTDDTTVDTDVDTDTDTDDTTVDTDVDTDTDTDDTTVDTDDTTTDTTVDPDESVVS